MFADRALDGNPNRVDTNNTTERTYNFLGGAQFKDNETKSRLKPFAHVLAGMARQTNKDIQTSTAGFNFTLNDRVNSFAMKIGGGLDWRISRRLDMRLIEFDYNPVFARDRDVQGDADFQVRLKGRRASNYVFSIGLAFH